MNELLKNVREHLQTIIFRHHLNQVLAPIYISLLPENARQVIGQVHPNTAPARAILEK
ncbi:arginine N-succinyltransferase, partial [Klebsiella quasipneumoniae]